MLFSLVGKKLLKDCVSLLTQKTIKNSINFQGVGLHSGKIVNLCLKNSQPDTGIVFKRIDLVDNNLIYPNFNNVTNTSLNTTISNEFGNKVSTIEHLMGALFGLGIDNVLVEIDNEEVPILDGSAKQFIEKILQCGFEISNKPIKIIKINKKVEFKDGARTISIEPSKLSLDIDFELKYENKTIGNQKNMLKDLSNSRMLLIPGHKAELYCLSAEEGRELCVPIITMGMGALKERVIHEKTGLIARNEKEFSEFVLQLFSDDLMWNEFRSNLIKLRNSNNWNIVAENLINQIR